jgi:hypothetical protein
MKRLRSEAGFASLVMIILIVILGGVSYGAYRMYAQQTTKNTGHPLYGTKGPNATFAPDPTAGWKIYSGAKYSLKYPSDWQVLPPISATLVNTAIISNRSSYAATDPGALFFLADSRPGTSIETCYANNNTGNYTPTQKPAKLGNLSGTLYTFNANPGKPQRLGLAYFAVSGGNCYSLTLVAGNAAARDVATAIAATAATTFTIK